MSNQPENPASENRSDAKTILIFVGVLAAICLICVMISVCGIAAFVLWAESNPPTQYTFPGNTPPEPKITSREAMDVTRAEMIEFFGADGSFVFGEPNQETGGEVVKGTHKRLCVAANCAIITLSGPEDNLTMVSAVAPTDRTSTVQTSQAITLLMKTARHFVDGEYLAYIPTQMMADFQQAQAAGKKLEISYTNNGYVFFELYDPDTQQAEIRISPYNGFQRPTGSLMRGAVE